MNKQRELKTQVSTTYNVSLRRISALGVSAMMHGYLAFDASGKLLVPFRTWRNTTTEAAARELTQLFNFNIPLRWSVAHFYQAILNNEPHIKDVDFLTTLSGYIHWKLSDEKILGVGDASGMFPVDCEGKDYNSEFLEKFETLSGINLKKILPKILRAGENAGRLTEAGAKLLDPSGELASGILMVPPEGDAGTGMVATNSVRVNTGNISVGTSVFSMNVLENFFVCLHRDVDMVATPTGRPVAMIHSNNCSSDLNAWVNLFGEFSRAAGLNLSQKELFKICLDATENADPDAGGLLNFSCVAGEEILRLDTGRPLFVRSPQDKFTLGNFFLAQLLSAFAPLKIGLRVLIETERVRIKSMVAQGGLFLTPRRAQEALANLLEIPISVQTEASDGGAFGMALLALFAINRVGWPLEDFLDNLFMRSKVITVLPKPEKIRGCRSFLYQYETSVSIEQRAGEVKR